MAKIHGVMGKFNREGWRWRRPSGGGGGGVGGGMTPAVRRTELNVAMVKPNPGRALFAIRPKEIYPQREWSWEKMLRSERKGP